MSSRRGNLDLERGALGIVVGTRWRIAACLGVLLLPGVCLGQGPNAEPTIAYERTPRAVKPVVNAAASASDPALARARLAVSEPDRFSVLSVAPPLPFEMHPDPPTVQPLPRLAARPPAEPVVKAAIRRQVEEVPPGTNLEAGEARAGGFKPLSAVRTNLAPTTGELPTDLAKAHFGEEQPVFDGSLEDRRPVDMVYMWEADALCHGALYFEDVNLERYGYSYGFLQPAASAIEFWGRIPALPYLVCNHRPRECVYTLGYYRPGSWAPYQRSLPQLRLKSLAFETVVVGGLIMLIP